MNIFQDNMYTYGYKLDKSHAIFSNFSTQQFTGMH